MNRFYRSLLLTGILAAGLAGCGDDVTVVDPPAPPPPPPPQVRAVSVTPDNVTVNPGQTIQMTANVTADAGATPTVTWSTSDATRATVSTAGLVTIPAAAPSGPVAIRATATANGSTASGAATLTVVGTTITGVTVTPATATINTNQTLQATASVQGTNNPSQAVNWSSLSPTVATVDANGLITANATTGGNAVIKACAASNGNICGTLAVEVVVPNPATVSIQSVTRSTGAAVVPVTLTNVFGQIEISLNVDNGSKTLTRVDALIGGTVVASQTFSSSNPAPVPGPDLAPVTVTLSVNTAQLRQNGGLFVPVIFNGNSAITANLFVVGSSTPIASNAIPVVMNNGDALVARNDRALAPTTSTPSVLVGANTWYTGTQTVSGYDYIAFGKAVPATVTLGSTICGASANLVPVGATSTSGIGLTGAYTCTAAEGGNIVAAPVTTAYAAGAVGPDGTPLTPPAGYSTVGSAFTVNNENRWNMIFPAVGPISPTSFIDNLAPSVQIAGGVPLVNSPAVNPGVLSMIAFNSLFDQAWIGLGFTFDVSVATPLDIQEMWAGDVGSGLAAGFPQARPITGAGTTALPWVCGTAVTSGADFAETVTSTTIDGHRVTAYAEDALGNATACGGSTLTHTVSNYFGADHVAPVVRLAGAAPAPTPLIAPSTLASVSATANSTIYGSAGLGAADGAALPVVIGGITYDVFPATDVWGLEALDTRSGFNQNAVVGFPGVQTLTRLAPSGATSCATFTNPLSTPLSDTYVRSAVLVGLDCGLLVGYYTYNGSAIDRAGNPSTTITRNFARDDQLAPNITGLGFASAVYAPGAPAPFGFSANDDLEIIDATLLTTQAIPSAGTGLRYPYGSLTALGTRWDATLSNVVNGASASIDFFLFRVDETCSGAAAPYASCPAAGPAPYITAPDTPVLAEYATGAAALPTNMAANVADVAIQPAAAPISAPMLPSQFAPDTGVSAPWAAADIISWDATADTTVVVTPGASLRATHVASTSIVVPYFDNASLWRINASGEWVRCATFPAPVLTDNGSHRFWTYIMNAPSTGACTGATFAASPTTTYRVMGRKGGAGLFSPTR